MDNNKPVTKFMVPVKENPRHLMQTKRFLGGMAFMDIAEMANRTRSTMRNGIHRVLRHRNHDLYMWGASQNPKSFCPTIAFLRENKAGFGL